MAYVWQCAGRRSWKEVSRSAMRDSEHRDICSAPRRAHWRRAHARVQLSARVLSFIMGLDWRLPLSETAEGCGRWRALCVCATACRCVIRGRGGVHKADYNSTVYKSVTYTKENGARRRDWHRPRRRTRLSPVGLIPHA